jgi:crossover junction endodeoxyribonuclease RuvC
MREPFFISLIGGSATIPAVGISAKDFERMQARINGANKRTPSAVHSVSVSTSAGHQTILGIDPSLRGTGFGIIRLGKPHPSALAHGTISCPAGWERSRCLLRILESLREQTAAHKPTACAIEGLFYAQNLQTALIMGEARGVALAAAAEAGLEIFEIAPRKVKQAIVGYGAAQKMAVAKMVQRMLQLAEPPSPDAADALALALAYAQETHRFTLAPPKKV